MSEQHKDIINICPVCDEGNLSPAYYDETFSHNGKDVLVEGLESFVCDACDATPIMPDQIKSNQIKIEGIGNE